MFKRMFVEPVVVNLIANLISNGCPSYTDPAISGDGVMKAATG